MHAHFLDAVVSTSSMAELRKPEMMLDNKVAVIYGAGGGVGGAVARAFARAGATLFLTGPHLAAVGALARDVNSSGGSARAAEVDALDEQAGRLARAATAKLRRPTAYRVTDAPRPPSQSACFHVQTAALTDDGAIPKSHRRSMVGERILQRRTEHRAVIVLVGSHETGVHCLAFESRGPGRLRRSTLARHS